MDDLLFDTPETKSPRLLWMEKHGITARQTTESEYKRLPSWEYEWVAIAHDEPHGFGGTEDEAITQLALRLGIKLWNEETKAECDRCFGNRIIDRPAMPDMMLPRYANCPKCNQDGRGGKL